MNKVITVSREFGSGGRELGVKLAEALGIPFYDKELISMAADDINIAEEAFRKYDEHGDRGRSFGSQDPSFFFGVV